MHKFRLASFDKRLLAFAIDVFVVVILCIPIVALLAPLGVFSFLDLNLPEGDLSITQAFTLIMTGKNILWVFLFTILLPSIYDALMTGSVKQATIGKMVVNTIVVKENGKKVTTQEVAIRALIKYLSLNFFFLFLLACLFNKERQNLHDLATGTLIIENDKRRAK